MNEESSLLLTWSDDYILNIEEIDSSHKLIFDSVEEIYEKLADTKKYIAEFPVLVDKVTEVLVNHMGLEIEFFQKAGVNDLDEHIKNHEYYKNKIKLYDNFKYSMPGLIRTFLILEVLKEYMYRHFFDFDVKAIKQIKEKPSAESKTR